jgi:hypothetical protein
LPFAGGGVWSEGPLRIDQRAASSKEMIVGRRRRVTFNRVLWMSYGSLVEGIFTS